MILFLLNVLFANAQKTSTAHVIQVPDVLFNFIRTLNIVNFDRMQSQSKIKLLLYGDKFLSDAFNKLLLKATWKFLKD